MKILEMLLFPLIVQTGAHTSVEDRIIKGEVAGRKEVKFLVSLWFHGEHKATANTPVKHECGGTLIASEWVLTAAHCFKIEEKFSVKEDWTVRLGKYQQNTTDCHEQILKIDEIILHPQFKPPNMVAYDIALLHLANATETTDYVVPHTELDLQEDCAKENTTCTVFGWGHRNNLKPVASNLPHKAEVKVTSTAKCERNYGRNGVTGDNFFCAIGEGNTHPVNDACSGDSGGPLLCPCKDGKTRLTGVVSAGLDCGVPGSPGGYTRLSNFRKFIKDHVPL